jgi:hypothetical protein
VKAEGTSWKREPFKGGIPVPYSASLTVDEFERVQAGLIPREMEDKWFIYYETPFLFFHRSWTGQPVYRLKWAVHETGASVEEALWSDDLASRSEDDKGYEALLIDFLVGNLLLGKEKPFPKPAGIREPLPGVYQHHISGTGYREQAVRARRPWWKLW